MVTEGYMSDVKDAIMTHISQADSSLQPKTTHIIGSFEEDIWNLNIDKMPIVTVRIGPSTDHEVAYGRKILSNESGIYVSFFFTAHIFHVVSGSGDISKSAMDLAEKIKTKLLKSDDAVSGIAFYRDIVTREAKINMHNVNRVVLEGYVFVKRPL